MDCKILKIQSLVLRIRSSLRRTGLTKILAIKRGRKRPMPLISATSGILIIIPCLYDRFPVVPLGCRPGSGVGGAPCAGDGDAPPVTIEASIATPRPCLRGRSSCGYRGRESAFDLARMILSEPAQHAEPGAGFTLSPELASRICVALRHWWKANSWSVRSGDRKSGRGWDLRGSGRTPPVLTCGRRVRPRALDTSCSNRATGAIVDAAGFGIEEGGFGKGIALREAADAARRRAPTASK